MSAPVPFGKAAGGAVSGLEIETDEDSLVLHGSVEIRRTRAGLETARALAALLAAAVASLEDGNLPEHETPIPQGGTVPNPFG